VTKATANCEASAPPPVTKETAADSTFDVGLIFTICLLT
jgi:hypothetical protein